MQLFNQSISLISKKRSLFRKTCGQYSFEEDSWKDWLKYNNKIKLKNLLKWFSLKISINISYSPFLKWKFNQHNFSQVNPKLIHFKRIDFYNTPPDITAMIIFIYQFREKWKILFISVIWRIWIKRMMFSNKLNWKLLLLSNESILSRLL